MPTNWPRATALAFTAGSILSALPMSAAQAPPQCISLAGSTSCPAFQDQYVSPASLVYAYDFFSNVTDRASFDASLWNYVYGSYATVKYGQDLGCANFNPTTEYARWTLTWLCGIFSQNALSDTCNSQNNVTPKMLCQSTCTEFANSEAAIVGNSSICGADQSGGSRQYWLKEDHDTCTDWTALATQDPTSTTCITGAQNEINCGFGSDMQSLCTHCNPSSSTASDSCCTQSTTDLSRCGFTIAKANSASGVSASGAAAQASALSAAQASVSASGLGPISSAASVYASTASGSVVSGPMGLTTLSSSGSGSMPTMSMTGSMGSAGSSMSGVGGAAATGGATLNGATSASDSSNNMVPSNSGLSGGAIAGIVIGSIVGAAIIAAILFFLLRRRSGSIFSGSSGGSQHSLLNSSSPQTGSPHHNSFVAETGAESAGGVGSGAGTGSGTGVGGAAGAGNAGAGSGLGGHHGGEAAGAAVAGGAAAAGLGIGAAAASKRHDNSQSTSGGPQMTQTDNSRVLAGSGPLSGTSRPGTAGATSIGGTSNAAGAGSGSAATSMTAVGAGAGAGAGAAGAAGLGAAAVAAGSNNEESKTTKAPGSGAAGSGAGSSSMTGSGTSSSNVISSYQDQYSPYAITPQSTVVAVYPYTATLADELSLDPDSVVFVRRMYDDGWAVGSIEDSEAPGGKRDGAFPLVCVTSKAGYDEQATGTSEGGQSSANDSGTLGGHGLGRKASDSQGTDASAGAERGNPHGWAGYSSSAGGSGYFGGANTATTTTDEGRSLHTADDASRSESRMSEDPSFQSFEESGGESVSSTEVPSRGGSMRRRP